MTCSTQCSIHRISVALSIAGIYDSSTAAQTMNEQALVSKFDELVSSGLVLYDESQQIVKHVDGGLQVCSHRTYTPNSLRGRLGLLAVSFNLFSQLL